MDTQKKSKSIWCTDSRFPAVKITRFCQIFVSPYKHLTFLEKCWCYHSALLIINVTVVELCCARICSYTVPFPVEIVNTAGIPLLINYCGQLLWKYHIYWSLTMIPYTVNIKLAARTLTGTLNLQNKTAVDWWVASLSISIISQLAGPFSQHPRLDRWCLRLFLNITMLAFCIIVSLRRSPIKFQCWLIDVDIVVSFFTKQRNMEVLFSHVIGHFPGLLYYCLISQ